MESSISASKLIPKHEQLAIRDIAMVVESQSNEGVYNKMSTLNATRAELALVVLYLNKAETRDKICRAILYGSKFLSNGEVLRMAAIMRIWWKQ
ncbi:hypothetical protein Syun_025811 [Stephania yunnanensis]|uniref:Uncharacterized protein n=1 Tax=Stephania yunnanensis TaxID=152371 RepID=A0AAP0ESD7_9MAGN